ncbi:MAG: nucleotide exchange factor GrpE [Bacilli bacterium]|nr:nucleotide exchange factor GrpE [Bacilli bacterium]
MPDNETGKEEKQEKPEKEMKKGEKAKLEEELEKAKADRDYWKNEYYKVFADTQNLRKSLEEDRRNALKYRAAGFLEELLPALDGYYSALSIPPASDEVKNYLIGFQYIYNQITNVLQNEGVSEFEPKIGDRFDATKMHAVDAVEDDGEENRILKVYAKGYNLHDRLIRAAMVCVSKKKEAPKAEEAAEASTDKANEA